MLRAVVLFLALIVVLPVSAATLHVARDGSGDFTVIQAAVDAAASGDTIMIGSGRYNEGAVVTTRGWTDYVRILIRQTELTLIGAGPDQTIIGPTTPWSLPQGDNRGIEVGTYWHSLRVHISGIGFENMGLGINGADAPDEMTIHNCRFFNNAKSVQFYDGGTIAISESVFDQMPRDYGLLTAAYCNSVTIDRCQFTLADANFWIQNAVHLEAANVASVTNCAFSGGDGALSLIGIGAAAVSGCQFHNQTASLPTHLGCGMLISGSQVGVSDCSFDMQTNALRVVTAPSITVVGTVIANVTESSIRFDAIDVLAVHNCVLARGAQYTVWQSFPCDAKIGADLPHLDMTNNDWGTSNADSIASWIRTCEYVVDYVPFMGQPVSTKSTSWGDLKAQFR